MFQSRRERAKQQYPTGGCEQGARRRRVYLASEVPFSQHWHAIHGSLLQAFSVESTSVTHSLLLECSAAALKANKHFKQRKIKVCSNGQELDLHTSKLHHCSPTTTLCLCPIKYIEQRSKQKPLQSKMSLPPAPKAMSSTCASSTISLAINNTGVMQQMFRAVISSECYWSIVTRAQHYSNIARQ